jgi:hypothetical protein
MELIHVTHRGAPQCSGGLVTGERAGRGDVQRRGRHLAHSDLESGSDVQTVEQSLETTASQLHIGEPNGERRCTCAWL